jgi:hypothetical protein
MQTFPLPEVLPVQTIIIGTALAAVVVFLAMALIWQFVDEKSTKRKYLPWIATAACLIGMGVIAYYGTIGHTNNETILRNSIVHNYNVDVLTFDRPKLTTLVGDAVRSCEMKSDDQINYGVQCQKQDGSWENLEAIKGAVK